jgi:hypothetical protein
MQLKRALAVLALAAPLLAAGTLAKSSALLALTTNGEFVELDAESGKSSKLGASVRTGGHLMASDALLLPGKRGVLITQVEIGDNSAQTRVLRLALDSGKTLESWPLLNGSLDALCQDGPQHALAVGGSSRPVKLMRLDLDQRSATAVATLDIRLWITSLAFDAQGQLWGLHMRTPELDHDALVRFDRATGAALEIVRLGVPTLALALEIDARGRFFVAADHDALHEVDPKSGKALRSMRTESMRIIALDPL